MYFHPFSPRSPPPLLPWSWYLAQGRYPHSVTCSPFGNEAPLLTDETPDVKIHSLQLIRGRTELQPKSLWIWGSRGGRCVIDETGVYWVKKHFPQLHYLLLILIILLFFPCCLLLFLLSFSAPWRADLVTSFIYLFFFKFKNALPVHIYVLHIVMYNTYHTTKHGLDI